MSRRLVRQLAAWGPVGLWMAVIAWLSGDRFSDGRTAAWLAAVVAALHLPPAVIDTANFILRKSAHFVEYAVLGLLIYRALDTGAMPRSRRARALGALVLAAGYASLDELHQTFTLTRTGTARDVLIDALGATAGASLGGFWLSRRRARAIGPVRGGASVDGARP